MSGRPSARMLLPSPALGACLFAGVERDTRGLSLTDAERFNYYPATPMATVSWIFEGSLHLVEVGGTNARPRLLPALPRLVFSGPQQKPTASWSPGTVYALSVAIYPEILDRLVGVRAGPFLDQTLPLAAVADQGFLLACESLFGLPAADEPFQVFQEQCLKIWRGPAATSAAPVLQDWIRALATRAAHSATGYGIRQFQRRIRHWTGQSHRELQRFERVEAAFVRRIEQRQGTVPGLAALATESGYADQSHMGREIRRVTGLSPAHFEALLAKDESFWFYRLLAGKFGGH